MVVLDFLDEVISAGSRHANIGQDEVRAGLAGVPQRVLPNPAFFIPSIRGYDEVVERASEGFVTRVAENGFCGIVPVQNLAILRNGKEGIGIVLEQQPFKNSFHGSASFGHALTTGHAEPFAIGSVEPASGPNGPMRRELFAQPLANGG